MTLFITTHFAATNLPRASCRSAAAGEMIPLAAYSVWRIGGRSRPQKATRDTKPFGHCRRRRHILLSALRIRVLLSSALEIACSSAGKHELFGGCVLGVGCAARDAQPPIRQWRGVRGPSRPWRDEPHSSMQRHRWTLSVKRKRRWWSRTIGNRHWKSKVSESSAYIAAVVQWVCRFRATLLGRPFFLGPFLHHPEHQQPEPRKHPAQSPENGQGRCVRKVQGALRGRGVFGEQRQSRWRRRSLGHLRRRNAVVRSATRRDTFARRDQF